MALQLAAFTISAPPRPLNFPILPFHCAASSRRLSAGLPPLRIKQRRRILAEIPSSENRFQLLRCLEAAMLALAFSAVVSGNASASGLPLLDSSVLSREPSNALSLPTWAIHISSVAEWVAAMALVWEYGEKSGFESWKGLSWGMVPLLGGALCACTWHFFYNSESLDVLVALQAALTVLGNFTMCIAAFRIYRSTRG
ncbi:uncharacterized protein LOC116262153 [Nymphaea colorata]|nr:uncharacterized protein LOC116262153 [Nymphaea colorata]